MSTNPWMRSHLAAEAAHTGGEYTTRQARSRVMNEYAGREDAITCGSCGELTAWLRATVGAYICVNCDAMRVGGRWVRT